MAISIKRQKYGVGRTGMANKKNGASLVMSSRPLPIIAKAIAGVLLLGIISTVGLLMHASSTWSGAAIDRLHFSPPNAAIPSSENDAGSGTTTSSASTSTQEDKKSSRTSANANANASSTDAPPQASCLKQHPIVTSSIAAQSANDLLFGDWATGGETGVILRSYDNIMGGIHPQKDFYNLDVKLLPAAFLHGSMRASNMMFKNSWDVGILVGSSLSMNARRISSKTPQNGVTAKNDIEDYPAKPLVNMSVCYPIDAGTTERKQNGKSVLLSTHHGGGCVNDWSVYHYNGTYVMDSDCRCNTNTLQVPSHGKLFADYLRGHRVKALWRHTCWYEAATHLTDLVEASNSLWQERKRWCTIPTPDMYMGWAECPVSSNIDDPDVADAVVIQLPITTPTNNTATGGLASSNVCHNAAGLVEESLAALKANHDRYGNLPILFMSQTKGMSVSDGDCDRYWGGRDCDDGYRKQFFAQTFDFSDGSCLTVPPGCEDVYFFPVDTWTMNGAQGTCNISTPARCYNNKQYKANNHLGSTPDIASSSPMTLRIIVSLQLLVCTAFLMKLALSKGARYQRRKLKIAFR